MKVLSEMPEQFHDPPEDTHEDFRRKTPDSNIVVEQIDGVIDLVGTIHLVEMKWLNTPVGIGEFSPHLSRLFM